MAIAGIVLVVMGAGLLLASGAYYSYAQWARSNLDKLDFLVASPAKGRAKATIDEQASSVTDIGTDTAVLSPAYPASVLHPKYWAEPLWAGTDSAQAIRLPNGFRHVSEQIRAASWTPTKATRIRIPEIGVDSPVNELQILDLGSSSAYETPDNVVGHIPITANPGQSGNGWFFGHLESPVKKEGNVFARLPEIRTIVEEYGDPVYIVLESDWGEFLYQVSGGTVVHQSELRLYESAAATVTLVTCVPRLVYDHRLLVSAELVGIQTKN